jgi:Secretion system C-terminal sorting domain
LIGGITAVLPFPLCTVINPRMTAEGDFDAQTYELLKSAAESGYATSVALVNTYPNPATSELKIDVLSAVSENITVSVYNMMGQEVMNSVINTQEGLSTHSVDVSALESGNYLIRIQTGTESVSKSFMVRN